MGASASKSAGPASPPQGKLPPYLASVLYDEEAERRKQEEAESRAKALQAQQDSRWAHAEFQKCMGRLLNAAQEVQGDTPKEAAVLCGLSAPSDSARTALVDMLSFHAPLVRTQKRTFGTAGQLLFVHASVVSKRP